MNLLTAVLNGIVRFFVVILNPVWYIAAFETIASRLRGRDRATDPGEADLATSVAKARRRKTTAVVAVLAIVGSLISLCLTLVVPSVSENNSRQPFVGLGQVLGEETAKILGDHGRVVVVIWDDYKQSGNLIDDALEAFRGVLKKHPNIQITATEVIRIETNQLMMAGELASGTFNELLRKHSQADGLVLFTGLPPLESQPPLQLPTPHPQIIAVQTRVPLTKAYFERQIVSLAISSSEQFFTGSGANPQTTREWFDRFFQVLTIENYVTLQN